MRPSIPDNPHIGEFTGFDRGDARAVQLALPEADINPLAVLEADFAIDALAAEADGLRRRQRGLAQAGGDALRHTCKSFMAPIKGGDATGRGGPSV